MQLLLKKGADVAAKDKDKWKTTHFVAANRHEAVIQLLLKKGADVKG